MEQAKRHVKFCTDIYNFQRDNGRYFLHEHPWLAKSWDLDTMTKLLGDSRVMSVQAHMCQFGMESHRDKVGGEMGPVKKPTGFASNSWMVMRELGRVCEDKSHVHVPLMGGRAAAAAIYPGKLCEAICRGIAKQKKYDNSGLFCSGEMSKVQLGKSIVAMMGEAKSLRSEESKYELVVDAVTHLNDGSSVYSPTTADDGRQDQEINQDAIGTGQNPKPAAKMDGE